MIKTAADLIRELQELPPDTVVFTTIPPFNGCRLIPQSTGGVLIAPVHEPEEKVEGEFQRSGSQSPLDRQRQV